jgi:hypothetical protein
VVCTASAGAADSGAADSGDGGFGGGGFGGGRSRQSGAGHQFHRPIKTAAAGTSSVRTRKVSIKMPSARPKPTSTIVLTFCCPALPEPTIASTPNVPASTSPAEVTVVPVAPSARLTASGSGRW